jgi:uncharacterized membrane protein
MNNFKIFLEYSIASFLEVIKKMDTWIYCLTFIAIGGLFFKKSFLVIILLILILVLSMIRDLRSPSFKRYTRDKKGIPSKSKIRRLKNDHFRRIQEADTGEESSGETVNFSRNRLCEQHPGSEELKHNP